MSSFCATAATLGTGLLLLRNLTRDTILIELCYSVDLFDDLEIGRPLLKPALCRLVSDGRIIVRHPDLQRTLEIADRFATELRM